MDGFTAIRNRLGAWVRLTLDLRAHFTVLASGQYGIAWPALAGDAVGGGDSSSVGHELIGLEDD